MSRPSNPEPRRYLIAIGSSSCPQMEGLPKLEQVENDIQRITDLFREQGYQRVLSEQIELDEASQTIKDAVSRWFSSSERTSDDCVIIYYGGHGDEGGRFGDHYLFTYDSKETRLPNTAIKTKELVEGLFGGRESQSPQNVLLILDVCYAGIGQRQTSEVLSKLNSVNSAGSGFWMIASSDSKTEAGDGAFVRALETVLRNDIESLPREAEFLSLDFLLERINLHFKATGQAQTAIATGPEFQSRAIFIRNPRFVSLQNANQLLPLLEQIERETLNSAYRSCYPQSIDYPFPASIEALLRTLIQLPQGIEERLPKFVSLLVQNKSLLPEKRQALENWGRQNLLNFEACQTQVQPSQPISTDFYLMVYVSENKQLRDHYTVRACLMGDHSTTQLSVPGDEDTPFPEEEIPSVVAGLVNECNRRGVALSDLSVQCFLPKKLLHTPIEQAEIEVYDVGRNIGSVCKTVVVRSSERQKDRRGNRVLPDGNWKKRWQTLVQCSSSPCRDAFILSNGDLEQFYQALEDYTKAGCGFEGLNDPNDHAEMFDEIFVGGFPIAIWLRPGHPAPNPCIALESFLGSCIGELPVSLTRRRRQERRARSDQDRLSHHVTLLWDNPFQPFPDDDWKGRSA